MYRKCKKLDGILYIKGSELYFGRTSGESDELIQITPDGDRANDFALDLTNVSSWIVTQDYLIVSFENDKTEFYDRHNKKCLFSFDEEISLTGAKEDDVYIYMKYSSFLHRFNKREEKMDLFILANHDEFLYRFNKMEEKMDSFILANENHKTLLFCYLCNDNLLFMQTVNKESLLLSYKNEPDGIELAWVFNLSSCYPDKTKRDIRAVKEYQGSLLVITTAGVVCLAVADGSVIWKSPSYAPTMEIVGNIGYVCTGLSLYKINLDTGEESGYGWENDRLPDFTYEGKECWPSGHDVVYHDGLLWYSVYSSGHSFLIAINPENGNYEWIHHVDTYDRTNSPQFYGNKLFLSDTGGLLHIYEKEEPSNTGNQYEASL